MRVRRRFDDSNFAPNAGGWAVRAAATLLAVGSIVTPATAALSPAAVLAQQQAAAHRMFEQRGFAPIADVATTDREVKRLLVSDPYMMLGGLPGIEIERARSGDVFLTVRYARWSRPPVKVDRRVWTELQALEPAVFAQDTRPVTGPASSGPPPICHGWRAQIETAPDRTTNWGECGGSPDSPRRGYAVALIRAAMGTRPDCAFDGSNPFWSFEKCFDERGTGYDDADLSKQTADLTRRWNDQGAGDLLGAARRALDVPGRTLGDARWLAARDAVFRFGAAVSARREPMETLSSLDSFAQYDAADRERLTAALNAWRDQEQQDETTYAGMLQELATSPLLGASASHAEHSP
jgi:hypothetical protein